VVEEKMKPILMAIGSGLVIAATLIDLFIRLRTFLIVGDRQVFMRGSSFTYRKYYSAGAVRNWSRWPAQVMLTLLGVGIGVFVLCVVAIHHGRG
jgi:hypothetical protein